MKSVHLCCGDVYLEGFENCDIVGKLVSECKDKELKDNSTNFSTYFKKDFQVDSKKRKAKNIIVDTHMKILEKWPWKSKSVDLVVMINALEHFDYKNQVPHIISEAQRVLKSGGIFKFDFPDIEGIVNTYYKDNPVFCMELIYGSRKNEYSKHEWGYTKDTIVDFFHLKNWTVKFRDVVKHDYPATSVWAIKK